MSGKRMTVEEVMRVVDSDSLFYDNSGGGVTLAAASPRRQGCFCWDCSTRPQKDRGLRDKSGHHSPAAAVYRNTRLYGASGKLSRGVKSLNNAGPHGLGEILYAYTSAAANNGSAFAGLNANTPFYNVTLAVAMFIGRFGVIIPMIAIAASMSNKKVYALSSGAVKSDNPTFSIFLAFTVLILGQLVT